MPAHPTDFQASSSNPLPQEHSDEEQSLQQEPCPRGGDHQRISLGSEEKEMEGGVDDWCHKFMCLIVLVALLVFLATDLFIEHQIKIINDHRFLKNLEDLKARSEKKVEAALNITPANEIQKMVSFSQSQNRKNIHAEDAKSLVSKPQQKLTEIHPVSKIEPQIMHETPVPLTQSKINPNMDTPIKRQVEEAKNGHTNVQTDNQFVQTPKPPLPQRAPNRPPPNRPLISGAGIPNTLIAKAKARRTLVQLPFDQSNEVSKEEYEYYEQKYQISNYTELPFCIVIPTYNNVKNDRYLKNIRSVVMQNYTNYHVIIIDDASTDGTGPLIYNFLNSQQALPPTRYDIIKNAVQMRAMPNLRMAAKTYCKPNEIFMIVDGDDELLGRQVFKLFNAKFQSDGLYFMYTNFLSLAGKAGYSRPFPQRVMNENTYRKYPFVTSHLRAFYTQLFLNIKEEDLKDQNGQYLKAANDVAICIPILEQSRLRVAYVPELTYLYNSNTGLNNHVVRLKEQRGNDKKIRKYAKYAEVTTLFEEK